MYLTIGDIKVFPKLILTQCPLAGRPSGYVNTVSDVKRMIVENGISLWVQLAPRSPNGITPPTSATDSCTLFPIEFLSNHSSMYSQGISNFVEMRNSSLPYVLYMYDLTASVTVGENGQVHTRFQPCPKSGGRTRPGMFESTLIPFPHHVNWWCDIRYRWKELDAAVVRSVCREDTECEALLVLQLGGFRGSSGWGYKGETQLFLSTCLSSQCFPSSRLPVHVSQHVILHVSRSIRWLQRRIDERSL